jgi:hypothetical protein
MGLIIAVAAVVMVIIVAVLCVTSLKDIPKAIPRDQALARVNVRPSTTTTTTTVTIPEEEITEATEIAEEIGNSVPEEVTTDVPTTEAPVVEEPTTDIPLTTIEE